MINLYNRKDLAEAWSTTVTTIAELQDTGLLQGRKIGKEWKYSDTDIETFLNITKGADVSNYLKMNELARKLKI